MQAHADTCQRRDAARVVDSKSSDGRASQTPQGTVPFQPVVMVCDEQELGMLSLCADCLNTEAEETLWEGSLHQAGPAGGRDI